MTCDIATAVHGCFSSSCSLNDRLKSIHFTGSHLAWFCSCMNSFFFFVRTPPKWSVRLNKIVLNSVCKRKTLLCGSLLHWYNYLHKLMFIYALVIELSARLYTAQSMLSTWDCFHLLLSHTLTLMSVDYSLKTSCAFWNVLCKLIELFLALSHIF